MTEPVHISEVRSLSLAEEGNSLRSHIQELKREESNLLGRLRAVMEELADTRMRLSRVNDEIARLAR